ncbi:MAG: GC-type dockerin domain-anchored protein [Phycisphaerales bacterium JB060]
MRRTALAVLAIAGLASFSHACPADLDGDGSLTVFDFLEFQNLFAAGDLRVDFDGDGDLTLFDFLAFQNAFDAGCPAGITGVELVGRGMVGYPHIEIVDTFVVGQTASIGIEPSAHPGVIGVPVDVFVVEARSQAQWDADATLVDARATGAQSVTFPGGTFASNVMTLNATALLAPGETEAPVAAGYDVVVDVDRDGMLSSGDLIDGLGDATGIWYAKDLTRPGPYGRAPALDYAVSWPGLPSHRVRELLVYPDDPTLTYMPVVIIAHGNGHDYRWYDYVQQHLASHGYVVMSHQNDTIPGIEAASDSMLRHADAFLGGYAAFAPELAGRVDTSRVMWIGHSRGGEGVVRATSKIVDGVYVPQSYSLDDFKVTSSIAPTVWQGTTSQIHDQNYHLLFGAADGDVCGCPHRDDRQSFQLYERGTGSKQSTYVHGADHNDFNCCGFDDFTGPPGTAIGRPEGQRIANATWLALAERYLKDNAWAEEFVWRHQRSLQSPSIAQSSKIIREHNPGPAVGMVVDDYQSEPSATVASSGAVVSFDVSSLTEGRLEDVDSAFTALATDPMNGMTRASSASSDATAGVVFEWDGVDAAYAFELPAGQRNLTGMGSLSLRSAQSTRHPLTTGSLADTFFTVELVDGDGNASAVSTGGYAGVRDPYARTGYGTGAGWQNEFETIRLRLVDFTRDGREIDLANIETIRLRFGPGHGSASGRIGLDDVRLLP